MEGWEDWNKAGGRVERRKGGGEVLCRHFLTNWGVSFETQAGAELLLEGGCCPAKKKLAGGPAIGTPCIDRMVGDGDLLEHANNSGVPGTAEGCC